MNINLLSFSFEFIIYLVVLIMAVQISSDEGATQGGDSTSVKQCRSIMAFDVCYWFVWFSLIVRTSITSYMNIKFSRDLQKTNSEFIFIFNENIDTLRSTVEKNYIEQVER